MAIKGSSAGKRTNDVDGLFLAPLLFLVLLAFAPPAHADTPPCDPATTTARGGYFTDYQSDEYSPQGFLIQHFKNDPTFPYAPSKRLHWRFFDDECKSATPLLFSTAFDLPLGVTDWSIRFSSPTHFDVWDDDHGAIVASSTINQYPPYASISFSASLEPGDFWQTYLNARTGKIVRNGTPPVFTGTLEKDPACPSMFVYNNLFDPSYEHAEYVDGLLRVHVRFTSLWYSGQWMRSKTLSVPASCDRDAQISFAPWHGVTPPPRMKYFSFRMTSPTHWIMWNDETDGKIVCSADPDDSWNNGCEGDLDPAAPYISFYMDIGGGSVATLITTPFAPVEQGCTENCNDNVLFLPGIEASRLYRPQAVGEPDKKLWEPYGDADALALAMNPDGTSVRDDIYTFDILSNAYVPFKGDVYKSFLADMNDLRDDKKLIEDWAAVPYDWRLSLDDTLTHGKQTGRNISYLDATSTPYIEQELRRLAATSRTGKVTIIAHSNGGLVAKALMQRLGATTTAALIDKVILVAVPQTGTPKAVGAILHGFEQSLPVSWFPLALSADTARTMAQHMPSAYNLLPSFQYFTYTDDAVITFDDSSLLAPWHIKYGDKIHSSERLRAFLTDAARPALPTAEDIKNPIVGNDMLLARAETLHNTELDGWTPPAGVRVIEIAGWGEDTLKTIAYYQGTAGTCTQRREDSTCARIVQTPVLDYKPEMTIDGDGTVVAPSALWTTGTERYWVNLDDFNNELPQSLTHFDRSHADFLEVPQLRTFIKNIITDIDMGTLPKFVSTAQPVADPAKIRLHFTLHSPLTLDLYDDLGNHTGIATSTGFLEENIPGSRYERFGGVTYATAPASTTIHAVMRGTAEGSFTLDVEESRAGAIVASTTFAGIPSSTTTIATIIIPHEGGIASSSPLTVDENGDGRTDLLLVPREGSVSLPDITPPEAVLTFATTTDDVLISGRDEGEVSVSPSSALSTSTLRYVLADESGNTTTLIFERIKEKQSKNERHGRITARLLSIRYGTLSTTTDSVFLKNEIQYEWERDKDGSLKRLEQEIKVKKDFTLRAKYDAKKNETKIYFVDKENKEKLKETRQGLMLIRIVTKGWVLGVEY